MSKKYKRKKQPLKIPAQLKAASRFLQFFSNHTAAKFALYLFRKPIKFKTPKRELEMDKNSVQQPLYIPALNNKINVYIYGESPKKVLLVHGWSGRGIQLYSIAERLLNEGYSTISFDAPGHGKSTGKTSDMIQFIECIFEIEKKYGPFEFAIGHSLGGMSILNAIKKGFNVKKAVIIGSGDIIEDIIRNFRNALGLNKNTENKMIELFEKRYRAKINDYSASVAAKSINIPVLIVHDKHDNDVPLTAAHSIHKNLSDSKLIITEKLGHRKILGDKNVINQIIAFLNIQQ